MGDSTHELIYTCTLPTAQNGVLITKLHSQFCTDTFRSFFIKKSSLRACIKDLIFMVNISILYL